MEQKLGSLKLGELVEDMWVFPKIGGKPPKSSILIGFSMNNHPFGGVPPYFWKHPDIFFGSFFWIL